MNLIDKLRMVIGRKASYYRAVFSPETVAGAAVLADLAEFCRAHEPTFHPDPRLEGVLQGRREVWLRIQNYAGLQTDDLVALRLSAIEAKRSPE